MVRKLEEGDKCECEGCKEEAVYMVYSRNLGKVVFCCDPHADIVVDEQYPEYNDVCSNCGCMQGVN